MFLGVSSPVVAMFVRGEVPREMRLLAARGLLTSDAMDRLALLALVTDDADADVAALARSTVAAIPPPALTQFLAGEDVPAALRTFFEEHGPPESRPDAPSTNGWPPLPADRPQGDPLDQAAGAVDVGHVTHPHPGVPASAPEADAAGGAEAAPDDAPSAAVVAALDAAAATLDAAGDEEQVHQLLTSLPVPEKIKLATLGRREQRAVLIRDPNRIVSTAVLASPKLTETEVEMFARMQNVSEDVLRIIGMSRHWVKSYNIVAALVKNPRTPTAVSLPLLPRLQERDVKGLTVNRNLPESVRLAARKFMAVQQERRGG